MALSNTANNAAIAASTAANDSVMSSPDRAGQDVNLTAQETIFGNANVDIAAKNEFLQRHPELIREQQEIARRVAKNTRAAAVGTALSGLAGLAIPFVFHKKIDSSKWVRAGVAILTGIGGAILGGIGSAYLFLKGTARDEEALCAKAGAILQQEVLASARQQQENPMALPPQPSQQPQPVQQEQPQQQVTAPQAPSFAANVPERDVSFAVQAATDRAGAPAAGMAP